MHPIFHGVVTADGSLRLKEPSRYRQHLRRLKNKPVVLIVREPSELRSASQNAYYHSVVVRLLSQEFGSTDRETHQLLKREFGIRSTATLESAEFEDFLERVRAWAQVEHHVTLPLPNETIGP